MALVERRQSEYIDCCKICRWKTDPKGSKRSRSESSGDLVFKCLQERNLSDRFFEPVWICLMYFDVRITWQWFCLNRSAKAGSHWSGDLCQPGLGWSPGTGYTLAQGGAVIVQTQTQAASRWCKVIQGDPRCLMVSYGVLWCLYWHVWTILNCFFGPDTDFCHNMSELLNFIIWGGCTWWTTMKKIIRLDKGKVVIRFDRGACREEFFVNNASNVWLIGVLKAGGNECIGFFMIFIDGFIHHFPSMISLCAIWYVWCEVFRTHFCVYWIADLDL